MSKGIIRLLVKCGGRLRAGVATRATLAGVLGLLFAGPAPAHIVTETPWHPLAAGYRTMMFLGDLTPVPWGRIKAAFDEPLASAVGNRSARDVLEEVDRATGADSVTPVVTAISAEDRSGLYATATRALSRALRHELDRAASSLPDQAQARLHVDTAATLYRAVADFIRQTDRRSYGDVGRAWLELTSSLGTAGVAGSGDVAVDDSRFSQARQTVDAYMAANFEPAQFQSRGTMTPLPESVVVAGASVEIAPWLPPGTNLNDQVPLPLLVLNFEERGIDETDLPLIAYGDMLFDSPEIFGEPARSLGVACSTCHNRSDINQDFFIPGVSHQPGAADVDGGFFNPIFNDRRDDSLDIPTLRGIRFTGPYGRDGRFASLREFTRNVIVGEFGGSEPTPFMLDALVGYMLEFDFLPNGRLDGEGRLREGATAAELRGEALFRKPFAQMDGKSCATCHVPSANFIDRLPHDIGSGGDTYADARDGAFDTPTLLGAQFTAPYFHDGSQPTLAGVVDWFDERFGLEMTSAELADLTAYVEAVGASDTPFEVYAGTHTPFRLGFEELTTFASTLDTLLPARDAFHATLLIDTVSTDLAADASGMANTSVKDQVYAMSDLLAEVGVAIDRGDWDLAEEQWAAFKERKDEYDAAMY